jgi:acetyltransferase-like isoleucine patch superfamily enzyme
MRGPTIKRGAHIGVNATLLPHIIIGESALIGAGSVVTQDIPASSVAYGVPAQPIGEVDELLCPYDLVERPYVGGIDVKKRRAAERRRL